MLFSSQTGGGGEQRLYTYSANEIRMAHPCGHEHLDGTRTSASCPSSDWPALGRFMLSGGGTGGIFGADLNHGCEELITGGVEQQSGDCVVFS